MIKIFLTGDNHFGLSYDGYKDVKEKIIESRYKALENCVRAAEEENCQYFVVAGDLFDKVNVAQKIIKRVVEILESFNGTVLVLPGNHDFYTEEVDVWAHFQKFLSKSNVVLLNEFRPYEFETSEDETVVFYPAFCQSKHAKENNLSWIKEIDLSTEADYRIGVAHGAIKGETPDLKQEYFLMTKEELNAIGMDAWLIGHTHIPFPKLGSNEQTEREVGRIFNAGSHQQTDISNNTEGFGFVISLKKVGSTSELSAHAVATGTLKFIEKTVVLKPDVEDALRKGITDALQGHDPVHTIVRLHLTGTLLAQDYKTWRKTAEDMLSDYLAFDQIDSSNLSEELTLERIRDEFPDMGAAYKLLEHLMDKPKEAQMAYDLLQECSH